MLCIHVTKKQTNLGASLLPHDHFWGCPGEPAIRAKRAKAASPSTNEVHHPPSSSAAHPTLQTLLPPRLSALKNTKCQYLFLKKYDSQTDLEISLLEGRKSYCWKKENPIKAERYSEGNTQPWRSKASRRRSTWRRSKQQKDNNLQENIRNILQEILKANLENIALMRREINQYNIRLRRGRLYVQENGRVWLDDGGHFGEGGGVVQGPLQLLHYPQWVLHEEAAHQASQAPG